MLDRRDRITWDLHKMALKVFVRTSDSMHFAVGFGSVENEELRVNEYSTQSFSSHLCLLTNFVFDQTLNLEKDGG